MSREETVSFSGYRPAKLPGGGDENAEGIIQLKHDLYDAVIEAVSHGFDSFFVGMADGFDMLAAETVLSIKEKTPHIRLTAVEPFEDGSTRSAQYQAIIEQADDVVTFSTQYGRDTYYVRNEYLVDHSSLLICYYDGRYGGTEYTVGYAHKQGVQIINLAPKDLNQTRIFDNVSETVRDDLERTIRKGSMVSIAAACFSIYAYEELKRRLQTIQGLRFIFTSPTFTTEKVSKSKREFYIPRLNRERSLYGSEFEVKLRNELTQKAIAKECAEWIRKKVKFKSNITAQNMQGFINVENEAEAITYLPLNGFTTVDIGCERGNNVFNLVTRTAAPASKTFIQTFESLWNSKDKLQDVTEEVIENISAVYKENPAEYIYFITLYNIFNEFLEDISEDVLPNEASGFRDSKIWNMLYNFQKDAALGIINKIEKYNGCILADSVGLGKTFTALAVIKYYENRNKSVLVLCPKKLTNNWNTYKGNYLNNPIAADRLRYDVLYHTDLSREHGASNGIDLGCLNWSNYDLVVIDESHNFRNGGELTGEDNEKENRYLRLLNKVIRKGVKTKVLMLSATPVNNRFNDLKNQIALAYEGDAHNIDGKLNTSRTINEIFRNAQRIFNEWSKLPSDSRTTDCLQKMLDFDFFEVLDSVTIARSRKQIEKHYDTADIGTFPRRNAPISKRPPLTSLDGAIGYNQIFEQLMDLNLSVYTPTKFILQSKYQKYADIVDDKDLSFTFGREQGIRRLTSINLMKRMESSVRAFSLTLSRIKELIESMIETIDEFEKDRTSSQLALTDISRWEAEDYDADDENSDLFSIGKNVKIEIADLDYKSWRRELLKDAEVLELLTLMVADITPEHDCKLQELLGIIKEKIEHPINEGNKKILIFSAYADTAEYLYEQVSGYAKKDFGLHTAMVTGSVDGRTTVPKLRCDLNTVLTCFSPRSKDKQLLMPENEDNIDILIATDCISEGQNLQDCDYLINYDIHWNPVRIIQRFGRIDRIGSKNECVQLVNFWPNITLDEYINLKSRVETRMKIVDMTATGDDNIISEEEKGDLEYRRKQLEKLQTEVVDLEDISGGISIMDLGLNEFRMDLLAYMKENPDIETAPFGLHTVVKGPADGVIFVLKNVNQGVNIESQNRLHPFYMVYMGADGEVLTNHLEPKATLDALRLLCKGKAEPEKELCRQFNAQTEDGRNMDEVSQLLKQAITSVIQVDDQSNMDSFLAGNEMSFLGNEIKGLDDFELICFVVVRGAADA